MTTPAKIAATTTPTTTTERNTRTMAKKNSKRNTQTALCPVSIITGEAHYYQEGTGAEVAWDVMGDNRTKVEVCPTCAKHALADDADGAVHAQRIGDTSHCCGAEVTYMEFGVDDNGIVRWGLCCKSCCAEV